MKRAAVLDDTEDVARVFFDCHLFESMLSPAAFTLRPLTPPEHYMSVLRTCIAPVEWDKVKHFKTTNPNSKVLGYATLNVGEVHKFKPSEECRATVYAHPNKKIPEHAGIHVYIADHECAGPGDAQHPAFLRFSSFLAAISNIYTFNSFTP